MLAQCGGRNQAWREVSRTSPCPICGKPDWCSISADGKWVVCRRVDNGAGHHRVDRAGADYWLYRTGQGLAVLPDPPEPEQSVVDRADDKVLHKVYSDLLSLLTLSPEHREDLRRRGLSDAEIEARQYRTLPAHGRAKVAKRLADRHGDLLLRVPGFYVKEDGSKRWWSLAGATGILIPVRDLTGRIVALKIRADNPGDGPRYTWLSSTRHGGPGPGNRVHCPLFKCEAGLVRVTEGELKADIATALTGILTLATPGVSCWRLVLPVLKDCGAKTVRLAFDADARGNRSVARALERTAEALAGEGYSVELETWDPAAGKGIDDLLAAGGEPQVFTGEAARAMIGEIAREAQQADPGPEDSALAAARQKAAQVLEAARTDPGAPFVEEALEALAVVCEKDPAEWQRVRAGLKKAKVALRDLERAVAKKMRSTRQEAIQAEGGLPYAVVGGRICYVKMVYSADAEDVTPVPIPLANFDARIVAEVVRDDGAEQVRVFVLEGTTDTGAALPQVEIPAREYDRMTWVAERWGTAALVYAGPPTRDHLRVAIQYLSGRVPVRVVFAHLGWRNISGKWVYLHAGGAIGENGSVSGIDVELEEALRDYVLPDPPAGQELCRAVRASLSLLDLAPERITAPLLGATYLAPMGVATELDLSVFLAGRTGAFKTSVTALCQAFWGSAWSDRHLPGSWISTANALEKLAFLAKDAVLVVDDFAPRGTASEIQRLHHEADRLLRSQGNRAGRARLRPDGTLRQEYKPRGIIISSGEDIPSGHSLRARACILEVAAPTGDTPGDVNIDRLTQAQEQAAQGLFAQAMAAYIRWLAPQVDALKASLPVRRRKLREEAYQTGLHHRVPDQVAALALGWETFLRFAFETGSITEEERAVIWRRVWAGLSDMATAQAEYQVAEDPVTRFLALLGAAIASGRAHVADAEDGAEPVDGQRWGWRENKPQGELVGWLEVPNLYLEPEAAYAVAQRLARDQGTSLPVTARTLWKRLAERGLLTATEPRKNTVKRVVAGASKRVISLHMDNVLSPSKGEMGEKGEDPTAARGSKQENLPHSASDGNNGGAKMGEQSADVPHAMNSPISAPPFPGTQEKWGRKVGPEAIEPQGSSPISPISPIPPARTAAGMEENFAAVPLDREEEVF